MANARLEYIRFMLPYAVAAIGKQHGWFVRWALEKSIQETGGNLQNVLIHEANNCLGIKGGAFDGKKWHLFQGVPVFYKQDSLADGRDDGMVPWRKFDSLADCFMEFVKMLNYREPYHAWQAKTILSFEDIYAAKTKGHSIAVLQGLHDVTSLMEMDDLCDEKGRIL